MRQIYLINIPLFTTFLSFITNKLILKNWNDMNMNLASETELFVTEHDLYKAYF